MKRFHVHVAVTDLDASVCFYTSLFGCAPSVLQPDYAKWQLDDPRVNFAISARGRAAGLDHLGIQVEAAGELADVCTRLAQAGETLLEQPGTTCCYARSDKAWVHDPQGIAWETFLTLGAATTYGIDRPDTATACCAPPVAAPGDAPAAAAAPVAAGGCRPQSGCC